MSGETCGEPLDKPPTPWNSSNLEPPLNSPPPSPEHVDFASRSFGSALYVIVSSGMWRRGQGLLGLRWWGGGHVHPLLVCTSIGTLGQCASAEPRLPPYLLQLHCLQSKRAPSL